MYSFRRLATATTVTTLLLVAIGGLVRATDSGLGCGDDWPDCNGRLIPVLNAPPVIIEWSHRITAMAVGFMVIGLVAIALRRLRERPVLVKLSLAALVLVVLQGLLGRVVVKEELEVMLVVAHLATALLFLAVLIVITTAARRAEGIGRLTIEPAICRTAWLVAGAVLVLLMIGSYTSDFGYMPGWPLQRGRIVPNLAQEGEAIHFIHRTLAALVGVIVVRFAIRTNRRRHRVPAAAGFAHAAAVLYGIEVLIGALNVWTTLNPIVVTFHLATGALVWTCLVAAAAVTSPAVELAASGLDRIPASGVLPVR